MALVTTRDRDGNVQTRDVTFQSLVQRVEHLESQLQDARSDAEKHKLLLVERNTELEEIAEMVGSKTTNGGETLRVHYETADSLRDVTIECGLTDELGYAQARVTVILDDSGLDTDGHRTLTILVHEDQYQESPVHRYHMPVGVR